MARSQAGPEVRAKAPMTATIRLQDHGDGGQPEGQQRAVDQLVPCRPDVAKIKDVVHRSDLLPRRRITGFVESDAR